MANVEKLDNISSDNAGVSESPSPSKATPTFLCGTPSACSFGFSMLLTTQSEQNDNNLLPTTKIQTNKGSGWYLGGNDPEHVLTTLPAIQSLDELPESWDWRDYNGTGLSLTTSVLNQMVPRACGSCWACATVSALSDRIRIAKFKKTGHLDAEVVLSPQVLLDCGMRSFGSCRGGDPRYAHEWIYENGICHTCTMNGDCFVIGNPKKYFISEYGTLNFTTPEEFQLEAMNEIYHRGPIVVSLYSLTPEFKQYKGGYILRDSGEYPGTTLVVSIVGWGADNKTGVKFWAVRNSVGTHWGDRGYFFIERGTNTFNIENKGAWAVPIV
ncbi:Papain family cysteine protease [Phytophthora infestans]|uniref:Papain family cysteine protease n=1 Tax=Phytophthora infestans TaxID=4787 RepID=A0A833TCL5_PHYIN|nr:Papain family cysteine protease [Phytophthora infestans]